MWKVGGGAGCTHIRCDGLDPILHAASDFIAQSNDRFRSRVRMWRGGLRFGLSVTAPFVWRCLNSRTITPFPHPPHRTGQAELPHPALGQDSRLHPRLAAPKLGQAHEPEGPVEVREWIRPALASPDLVLMAQPPAQPRSGEAVERTVGPAGRPYPRVVRPAAQSAVQLLHQLRGLAPVHPATAEAIAGLSLRFRV